MAKKASAGDLYESVAFDKRVTGNPDSPADYGQTEKDWVEQLRCRAKFVHLRGGEAVMGGRLMGRHPVVVTVYATSATRAIAADWRMRDVRTSVEYAVRDITPSDDRRMLDILVESGSAP